jgi:hypothetical protein
MSDFIVGLMIGMMTTAMVMVFSIRMDVTTAALGKAEQVCTVNDGMESITVDTSGVMKVNCSNGATFKIDRGEQTQ